MRLKPEEISRVIREQIKNYEAKVSEADTGTVLIVGDGIARVSGLDRCVAGELLHFATGGYGMAMNLEEYADAVGYFEKALELAEKKETQNIWRNLIAACEYSGDFERAYKEAGSYLRDYPKDESMTKEYEFLKTRISGKEE